MTHKPDAVEWTEMHFINPHAKGVLCFCGADATHKVGEEIPRDDPYQNRHNFTQYVCCQCFVNIVGNAAFCGLTRNTAELDALRREVEAGKRYKNLACKTDRFEGVAADGSAWSITWRDDRWYWINREVVSVMDDPIEALELLAALEGESR